MNHRWSRRGLLYGFGAAATYSLPSMHTQAEDRTIKTIELKDFGVIGDGNTDDAFGINSAIDHIRMEQKQGSDHGRGFCLRFHPGIYLIKSPINLTGFRRFNVVVDGSGSTIVAVTNGKPAIDAIGSRWLHLSNISVWGDPVSPPNVGLQIGRVDVTHLNSADSHFLENVSFNGQFSTACLLNFSSESSTFLHCFFWNKSKEEHAFCLIQDGANHFQITSTFVVQNAPRSQPQSFNENLFIGCDFRRNAAAPAIFLSNTSRHLFQRCYIATNGTEACHIDLSGASHKLLGFDCHVEGRDIEDVFLFKGARSGHIMGLSYTDHEAPPHNSIFRAGAGVHSVTLENACVQVPTFANRTGRVFDDPMVWEVSGDFYSSETTVFNMPRHFSGCLTVGVQKFVHGYLHT